MRPGTLALMEIALPMFRSRSLHALRSAVVSFAHEDGGQDLIEYALIAACIALGVVAASQSLTGTIASVFSKTGSTMNSTV